MDNGKVSFSNPARQNLYTFQDCTENANKVEAAVRAMERIDPNVVHPPLPRSLHFQTSLPFPFPFFKGESENHSPSTHTPTPFQCPITLGVSSGRSTTSFWTWFSGPMWCFCWSIREKQDGILHSYVWLWRNWSLMPRWGLNRLL